MLQMTMELTNGQVTNICSIIRTAAVQSMPTTAADLKPKGTLVPWWNNECQLAYVNKRRAETALRKNPNLANKTAFKQTRAMCR